jgi:DNA-binding response OmpR family regulator
MRRLISLSLEHSNLAISVVTAASGAEAIDLAQQDPPDLVLLDVMMPGMDGFAVCEQLRGNVRTAFIPILMLTARDDAASRARGFLAGTDDYLGKPFARAELLARVRRLIERTYGAILPSPPTSAIAAVADASADFHRVSLQ